MSIESDHRLEPAAECSGRRELIGDSLPIVGLKKMIAKMAGTDFPVLVSGETGTGKELVALTLHQLSARSDGPFVAVNCPAVPSDLFQAEVFGYEKGAFTGAERRHEGRIDVARGGTLFLDEIGDMPPDVQSHLLRFLQEGTFERLGSAETIAADVRIIAATHIDLADAVKDGRFREDLYYRLEALHIRTPPLRSRGEDKLMLAEHFLTECARKLGLQPHGLTQEARESIMTYDWPGNVRELRNHILQALVLCDSQQIDASDLNLSASRDDHGDSGFDRLDTLREYRQKTEREAIKHALRLCEGCVEAAASRLEISRAQMYRLMKTYGIST